MDIILIPGFWLDASSWDDIVPALGEERHGVSPIVIACEFSSAQLREWMAQDHLAWRELPKVRDVGYIELPTGRWPQLIKSGEPGRASVAPPEEMTRL